jgi:hypothetical protein
MTRAKISKLSAVASVLATLCVSAALAQNATIEMHWVGLFGAYSSHPLPNDPLPDVTLFPWGELPRPLAKTNRVPAKLGTRFGVLFTLHGLKEGFVQVVQVVHYPSPGLVLRPGEPATLRHDDRMLCIVDKPCYVGYSFQSEREILSGEWRMELHVNGSKLYEATFVVAREPEMASNNSLERTREK